MEAMLAIIFIDFFLSLFLFFLCLLLFPTSGKLPRLKFLLPPIKIKTAGAKKNQRLFTLELP